MKITITRALREIKLIDKRIRNKISSSHFVACKKGSSEKVNRIYTIEEYSQNAESNFQSIIDLIERRKIIKSKISISNAKKTVKIAGKKYIKSEAIERKNSIEYEKELLDELKKQYRNAVSKMNYKNEEVQERLDQLMIQMVGKDKKDLAKENEAVAKVFRDQNEYSLVDPLKIEDIISKMEKEIDDFEAEVDFVLSEANSMDTIEVPE